MYTACGNSIVYRMRHWKYEIEKVSKAMLPLYIPMLITLLLVTFIPALTMTLPELIMK